MSKEHDRESAVAAYVVGELSGRTRRRFEAHLLECEACWHEVQLGREGRRAAESLRELAPASLREDVRAAVGLSMGSGHRTTWPIALQVVGAAVVITLAAILVGLARSPASQPPPIAAALSAYRSAELVEREASGPSLSALGLRLRANSSDSLATLPAREFLYSSPGGSVALFVSTRDFPEAAGATERGGMSHGWTARDGDLFMACGSRPIPYLVIGADPRLLARIDVAISSGSIPIAS